MSKLVAYNLGLQHRKLQHDEMDVMKAWMKLKNDYDQEATRAVFLESEFSLHCDPHWCLTSLPHVASSESQASQAEYY